MVEHERVIALDLPEYAPIVVLTVRYQPSGDIGTSVRFRLSDEERLKVAGGCDLVITELTGGRQFTPINVQVCKPNEAPEH